MIIRGTIYEINRQRGMVAVLTENGDYSVFELRDEDSVEEGDEVSWENDTVLGSEMLRNITQSETFEVYFQTHWIPKNQLRQQLLY